MLLLIPHYLDFLQHRVSVVMRRRCPDAGWQRAGRSNHHSLCAGSADCAMVVQGVVRQQDLALMQVAIDKGKPVMFAINKTDCIPAADRGPILRHLLKQLSESISQVLPILCAWQSAAEE